MPGTYDLPLRDLRWVDVLTAEDSPADFDGLFNVQAHTVNVVAAKNYCPELSHDRLAQNMGPATSLFFQSFVNGIEVESADLSERFLKMLWIRIGICSFT